MSLKKPSLNRDILEEIVPYFNQWNLRLWREEHVEALTKFMLSGKESYEAVLRHFSHAETVVIAYNTFRIVTKRHILKRDRKCNLYKFSYDFSMLDDILKVLEKPNTKLEIEAYPPSAAGRKVLARLTRKDLKFIGFDSGDVLPSDYYKFFKECNFDDARLILCCVKKPTLSEFFELSSKHRSLTTHFMRFLHDMLREKRVYPAVESLSFDPCFCEEDFEDFPFVFTNARVSQFSRLIIEAMPNLKKLVAEFCARPEQPNFNWKRIYNEMKNFNPEMFSHIPLHVKGSFDFYVSDYRTCLKDVIEFLPKTNPGVEIDDAEKRLVKKFDIHDGLTFEFVYQLREDESAEEEESNEALFFEDEEDDFNDYEDLLMEEGIFDEYEGESGRSSDEEENEGSASVDGEEDVAKA